MNVWSVQQQQDRKVNTPDQASALEVLQRLPHSLFEAAARKLCKRSAALSLEECEQYKRAASLKVMSPRLGADLVGLRACAGTCGSLTDLLPTPTSVLDGPAAFPPSPPQEESVDFLVASSPGSQSCVGESGSGKHRSPVTC
ncbi:hypothetical protein WJX75_005728 [Coccomyxa subellipsoidea]|uniref:Uncharacterized protein n=1 Tax=Coccomyxa subellipsoidea TaxID=248742 RepID=A0ABR2YC89_9CHLO